MTVRYVPRGEADVEVLQRMRKRIKDLEKALVRAVENHGHDFHCSASRGLESECHCGWTKLKAFAKTIPGNGKQRASGSGDQ